MTPEEQRAWIMKYDDPPSCPHGIMIGCRVCADANASPAEGEVTTGEAERFAEIVEQARKNVAPIVAREEALLVHSMDCAVHLPTCRPCSCYLETKLREQLAEALAANASLRAKLADVRVKAIRQVRLVRRYYFSCNPPNTGLAQGFNFILNALDATEEERKSPL